MTPPFPEPSSPSRVFRQAVTIEVFWIVEPNENEFRDWEGVVRDAVLSFDPPGYAGVGTVTKVQELTA